MIATVLRSFVTALVVLVGVTLAQDFTIVHFNDVYEIEPVDGGDRGGAARISTLLDAIAAEHSEPLIVFSGDAFSPSIMSSLFQGAQMVDAFNRLGTDVAVFGNHEFDYGPEVAQQRVSESTFPWLSTNLVNAQTGEPLAGGQRTLLLSWNGVPVGFMGIVGNWLDLTSAGPDARIDDPVVAAQAAVDELRDEGARVVVAVTHMTIAEDRMLAESVDGIDLILGGHDHDPINEVVNGTLIWKTGSDWRYLGELRVFDLHTVPDLVLPREIPVDTSVAEDAGMAAFVADYSARLDSELGQSIGETTVVLDATRSAVRSGESTFGNLIADAGRAFTGADVAIMNGGGIRTDATYGPGELTRRDVLGVLPFGNILITVELSGADLRQALENGVSQVEDGAGRFPQVSGMSFSYDPARPAGERVLEVTVGGEPLDEDATYVVAINDYIGGGGDGYEVFEGKPRILNEAGGPLIADVVMNYVQDNSPVAPAIEGRIRTP